MKQFSMSDKLSQKLGLSGFNWSHEIYSGEFILDAEYAKYKEAPMVRLKISEGFRQLSRLSHVYLLEKIFNNRFFSFLNYISSSRENIRLAENSLSFGLFLEEVFQTFDHWESLMRQSSGLFVKVSEEDNILGFYYLSPLHYFAMTEQELSLLASCPKEKSLEEYLGEQLQKNVVLFDLSPLTVVDPSCDPLVLSERWRDLRGVGQGPVLIKSRKTGIWSQDTFSSFQAPVFRWKYRPNKRS